MNLRFLSKQQAEDAPAPMEFHDVSPRELSPSFYSGRGLSNLSMSAKSAMSLNEIHRVEITSTYESNGATIYIVTVFLRTMQKGLPTADTHNKKSRRVRQDQPPDYQVERRYSDFRTMVQHLSRVVKERRHFLDCAYCSRVGSIKSIAGFPPRVPHCGALAGRSMRHLLVRIRKHRLENFMNQLLKASKDMSYRANGSNPCDRFLIVSCIVSSFLTLQEGARVSATTY
ncbi:hypothetical protein PsorP6_001821 [Peronosclerospora sorghi]|uniref:Uncharacterized protein n=1 Tax=Peronosclerospora sorghi TaxID=230839 RepID=A0ACC0WQS8_9STRA|nr:hypothetical protein PsorP6_001821 [Peronosclerospora sorghi]